jgi:hypothetical protein
LGRDSALESIFSEAASALNFCFFFFKKKEEQHLLGIDLQHLKLRWFSPVIFSMMKKCQKSSLYLLR